MTDFEWPEQELPEPDDEVLAGFDAGGTADDPHSSTWVRTDSPWHADPDPHAAGEWIADVERPAEH